VEQIGDVELAALELQVDNEYLEQPVLVDHVFESGQLDAVIFSAQVEDSQVRTAPGNQRVDLVLVLRRGQSDRFNFWHRLCSKSHREIFQILTGAELEMDRTEILQLVEALEERVDVVGQLLDFSTLGKAVEDGVVPGALAVHFKVLQRSASPAVNLHLLVSCEILSCH